MRLESLYPNFSQMTSAAQEQYVIAYRERRAKEIEEYDIQEAERKTRSKRAPVLKLTPEEEALIKQLGITKRQLLALKATQEN